ncbi:MAG: hypothetical protein LBG63_05545 [Candidatus Methanoplasma sp.]|jgi:hypothetical protein|nr:hypothetical protein [Candidatus Methanoplasma sp.]
MDEASGEVKQKAPRRATYLRTIINPDEETKHDKLDKFIVKVCPPFAATCTIFALFLIFYMRDYSFTGAVFGVCLGFALGFIILGVVCVILSDRGVITRKYVVPVVIIVPMLIAVVLYYAGTNTGVSDFIVKYFDVFGKNMDMISLLVGVYSIALMVLLVAYAVVSVIVSYFRSYFYRVLRSLENPLETKRSRITNWLFQIPDIIDVRSVELEPDTEDNRFNLELFVNIAFSLFLLGIVICSYLFINPLFLEIMSFEEMLLIGMLMSLFISPLVIPWSIVKSVGAKITSDAPRDFYLWKGMRGRLYQGFFTITFFMMLLTLSVYLGMDFSRILMTYLGYVSFIGVISIVTSFVYVNTYYKGFKNGIIKSYLRSKEQ